MDLYILNESFEPLVMINDSQSVLWNKKYNDTGSCELYISCTKDLLNTLKMDFYIYRYDDDMVCKIADRKIHTTAEEGDYLTVEGIDICDMLSGRFILTPINFSGKVVDLIERILNENVLASGERQIANFTVDDSNFSDFTEEVTIQLNYKNEVLATIKELCQAYGYGFRLTYANGLIFKLYKGVDKSSTSNDEYVEFSDDYGNILNSTYQESKKGFKTVAIVGGVEAEDGSRLMVSVGRLGETSGISRQELFVDGSSIKNTMELAELQLLYPNGTVSGNQYILNGNVIANKEGNNYVLVDTYYEPLLEAYGTNILTQYDKSYAFDGAIDTADNYVYKADYNLGDKVKFINEYNISASATITEVLESEDENGYSVEPKFNYEEVDD